MSCRCPFCAGSVSRSTFAETAHSRALYNLAPLVPGHSLIVPRRHVTHLSDLGSGELMDLISLSRNMAQCLMAVYGCDGYDLSLQDGEAAGQTVPHLHLHIVPRRPGDRLGGDWHDRLLDSASRQRLTSDEMMLEVTRIRRHLR